jgi:hypothetical protein
MRTCAVSTHGNSIVLKDETAKKVMSILPNREALEELLAFCRNALRDWNKSQARPLRRATSAFWLAMA